MNTRLVALLASVLAAQPLCGQMSRFIPQHAKDSLAARDTRTPAAQRDRQRALDSLAAGRRRWAAARAPEYQLQVHAECFCLPPDSVPVLPLVIVRDGAIVAHARGRPVRGSIYSTTIDSLFALIERDVRDPGRVVRQLDLDRDYGFPRDYYAETPPIPDLWLRIHVDSFAVTEDRSRSPQ